ncbi:MAG: hypothetical protein ACPGVA_15035 [Pikeienuella sp.]
MTTDRASNTSGMRHDAVPDGVEDDALAIDGRGRHVLLLQGPSSPFMAHLGAALRARGARVSKIHLCPGDWVMWRGGGAHIYRGKAEDWRDYVARFAAAEGVTDLICLSSARRYHQDAIAVLAPTGVRTTIIEHGYLRPGYLLAEPEGTGGESHFPREGSLIEALANSPVAEPDALPAARAGSFALYAALDVTWNLANVFFSWVITPGYRRHALDHPLKEYSGWIGKLLTQRARSRLAKDVTDNLSAEDGPVFLLPLQLETDFQIRRYGTGWSLREELEETIVSFAAHAPKNARLLVKTHPLDNRAAPWARRTASMAWRQGVEGRVLFVDGGDLDLMLKHAAGVVTVNSTVGLTAILRGVPVIALGDAVYDLPELTHQGDLADFWRDPQMPDATRAQILQTALLKTVHVGGAFDGAGMAEGAAGIADKALSAPPFGPFAHQDPT